MRTQTIARNRAATIAAIFDQATSAKRFDYDNSYRGTAVEVEKARHAYQRFTFARLVKVADGQYRVDCHEDLWYELN